MAPNQFKRREVERPHGARELIVPNELEWNVRDRQGARTLIKLPRREPEQDEITGVRAFFQEAVVDVRHAPDATETPQVHGLNRVQVSVVLVVLIPKLDDLSWTEDISDRTLKVPCATIDIPFLDPLRPRVQQPVVFYAVIERNGDDNQAEQHDHEPSERLPVEQDARR